MKLKELLNGIPCVCTLSEETEIRQLVYDTRSEMGDGDVFVCIAGYSFDGHDFINEAYKKGVRIFAIERDVALPENAYAVRCDDTRKFLALASANFFGRPAEKLITIALTGTKGKTSTSFMLRSILEKEGIRTGVIGSTGIYYGDHYEETGNTTPESFLLHKYYRQMLDAGCQAVIIEAASQGFKLHRTYGIRFNFGAFTNISPDHIGKNEHADFEEYLNCKKCIFDQSEVCYVNGNDPHIKEILCGIESRYILYGDCVGSFVKAEEVRYGMQKHQLSTSFVAMTQKERIPVSLGVPGSFSVTNAITAIAIAKGMGVSSESIQKGLSEVRVRGRMEIVPIDRPYTVIIDAAHEEFSCRALFETIRQYQPKRIISVFGCGGNRSKLRRYGMGEVIGKNSDLSIITSDNSRLEPVEDIIRDILVGMQPTGGKYEIIISRKEAIRKALRMATKGDCILLIGKGHETYEDIGGKKTPFNEKQIVLDFIEEETQQGN